MLKTQEPDNFRNTMKDYNCFLPYLPPSLPTNPAPWIFQQQTILPSLPHPALFYFSFPFLRKERSTTESFITHIRK